MKLHYLILLLLSGILIPSSCTVEEDIKNKVLENPSRSATTRSTTAVIPPDDVFDYTDIRLTVIVNALQTVENKSHFMESFCESFGIPLWNYAIIEEDEYQTCYYIPLFHPQDSSQINSIWFFCLEKDRITYMPIRRENEELAQSGQSFIFDALSCTIFGESDSALIYRKCTIKTRAWATVTTCWNVHTGPNMESLEFQYTECSDKTIWVDLKWSMASNLPGSGAITLPGGSGGIGGIGSASSNAQGIFLNTSFREDDWKIVEKLLDEIEEDCIGKSLTTGVKDAMKDNKIK